MSVVGSQPKKKNVQIPVIKQQNTMNTLFLSLIISGNTYCNHKWPHPWVFL